MAWRRPRKPQDALADTRFRPVADVTDHVRPRNRRARSPGQERQYPALLPSSSASDSRLKGWRSLESAKDTRSNASLDWSRSASIDCRGRRSSLAGEKLHEGRGHRQVPERGQGLRSLRTRLPRGHEATNMNTHVWQDPPARCTPPHGPAGRPAFAVSPIVDRCPRCFSRNRRGVVRGHHVIALPLNRPEAWSPRRIEATPDRRGPSRPSPSARVATNIAGAL